MSLPSPTNVLHPSQLPPLPASWSELTWSQLCAVWEAKMRYGGNADVAVCAALLALIETHPQPLPESEGSGYHIRRGDIDPVTGEQQYVMEEVTTSLHTGRGRGWVFTPRQLSWMAKKALPWFAYPYGDQGDREQKDEQGKVIREKREGHAGYVNPDVGNWRDAMALPEEVVTFVEHKMMPGKEWEAMSREQRHRLISSAWDEMSTERRTEIIRNVQPDIEDKQLRKIVGKDWRHTDGVTRKQILRSPLIVLHFALPAVACSNLTWHQYRSLQALVPQLFQDGISDDDALQLQAQFMAYITVPEPYATPNGDPFPPHNDFHYKSERAEASVPFWRRQMEQGSPLFNICFQVYQTAIAYYAAAYPLLFSDSGKQDPLRDALTGEVGTINTVMKYAGYSDQQQVYDSNLPFIFDILNTMTKEAKEIEKMNAKIKHKK